MNYQAVNEMLERAQTYYGRRIAGQLDFACVLNDESGNKYEDVVSRAIDCAYAGFVKNGAVTKKTAEKKGVISFRLPIKTP